MAVGSRIGVSLRAQCTTHKHSVNLVRRCTLIFIKSHDHSQVLGKCSIVEARDPGALEIRGNEGDARVVAVVIKVGYIVPVVGKLASVHVGGELGSWNDIGASSGVTGNVGEVERWVVLAGVLMGDAVSGLKITSSRIVLDVELPCQAPGLKKIKDVLVWERMTGN